MLSDVSRTLDRHERRRQWKGVALHALVTEFGQRPDRSRSTALLRVYFEIGFRNQCLPTLLGRSRVPQDRIRQGQSHQRQKQQIRPYPPPHILRLSKD